MFVSRGTVADPQIRKVIDRVVKGSEDQKIFYVTERVQNTGKVAAGQRYELECPHALTANGKEFRVVPALKYENASARGRAYVKFDAIDPSNPTVMIDRKLGIGVRRSNGEISLRSGQRDAFRRQRRALIDNPDVTIRYEVPNATVAGEISKFVEMEFGALSPRVSVVVRERISIR